MKGLFKAVKLALMAVAIWIGGWLTGIIVGAVSTKFV